MHHDRKLTAPRDPSHAADPAERRSEILRPRSRGTDTFGGWGPKLG